MDSVLSEYKPLVENELDLLLSDLEKTYAAKDISVDAKWILAALREYCLRPSGKRLRGVLAAAVADIHGAGRSDALKLGAVMEMIQAYLLVVDDVMDRSALRRGGPTLHKMYLEERTGVDEFSTDMVGILGGMMMQHLAQTVLSSLPKGVIAELSSVIHDHLIMTSFGQLDDLTYSTKQDIGEDLILRTYKQKSGYYTFSMPLICSLILSGKDSSDVRDKAIDYGRMAGVAYQLYDDYVGIFSSAEELGKNGLDDIREGKMTLMHFYARSKADEEQKDLINRVMGDRDASLDALFEMRGVYQDTGAAKHCLEVLENAASKAKNTALEGGVLWGDKVAAWLVGLMDKLKITEGSA